MAVPIKPGQTLGAGVPKALFERRLPTSPQPRNYDVSADGQRFLVIKEGGSGQTSEMQPQIV